VLAVVTSLFVLAFTMLFPFRVLLPRFVDVQRWVAGVGDEGARRWIFRFRGQRLAAVADADRFFFQPFYRARGRAGACEQKRASDSNPRGSVPEPSHLTISTVRRPIYQETRWYA
jgi:hypothetical protein